MGRKPSTHTNLPKGMRARARQRKHGQSWQDDLSKGFAECFRVLESGAKVEVMKVEVLKS